MKKNTKKGFTLVELVIVIAVIAILSAILIPTFGDIISNANETAYQKAADSGFTEALDKYATKVSFDYAIVVYYDGGLTVADDNSISTTTATRAYKIDASKNISLIEAGSTFEYNKSLVTNVANTKVPTIAATITNPDVEGVTIAVSDGTNNFYYINNKIAIAFFKAA